MANVAWSTPGEAKSRQRPEAYRIAHESLQNSRMHSMARGMVQSALGMARVRVARLARRRERTRAEEVVEEEEEEAITLDLFD